MSRSENGDITRRTKLIHLMEDRQGSLEITANRIKWIVTAVVAVFLSGIAVAAYIGKFDTRLTVIEASVPLMLEQMREIAGTVGARMVSVPALDKPTSQEKK